MNLYLNDLSDNDHKQMAECNRNLCVSDGYDRLKFANPNLGIAGDLGFHIYKNYWDAPVIESQASPAGDLEAKNYAVALVPYTDLIINPNDGNFLRGLPMHRSDIILATATHSLKITLPDVPEDGLVFFAGFATGGDATTLQDNVRSFTVDALIGFRIVNLDTGISASITANTATEITVDNDMDITVGDRYHIYQRKVAGYDVYLSPGSTDPRLVDAQAFVKQLECDADSGTVEIMVRVTSGTVMTNDQFPPDPYRACVAAESRLICGGGVNDSTGQAEVDESPIGYEASAANPIAVTNPFHYAILPGTSSDLDNIIRLTLPAGETFGSVERGSVITVSGSEDADNDIEDAIVTDCDPDGNWIEFRNGGGLTGGGAVNADDETMLISGTRNVLVGNTSGVNKTAFAKGMVGSYFKFEGDMDAYQVAWVDELNQEIGLYEQYVGINGGQGANEPRPLIAPFTPKGSMYFDAGTCLYGQGVADITTTGFTLSFWRYISADSTNEAFFFRIGDMSRVSDNIQMTQPDSTGLYTINSSLGTMTFASTALPNGSWHHIAITYNSLGGSDPMMLYVNGVNIPKTSSSATGAALTILEADTDLMLGGEDHSAYHAGVKIYDRAVNSSEALAISRGGLVSGMIAIYPCNENTGDVCGDLLGGPDLEYYTTLTSNWVPDAAATGMSWTEFTYDSPVIENNNDIRITSDLGIGWSDSGNPHIFRTENYTPVSDTVSALAVYNQTLLLFCENSIQLIPLQGLGQSPYVLSNTVQCNAPHSIVATPIGVFFYDGSGISLTDGQQIIPVTAYKANDYLGYINNGQVYNMRGVYDPEHRRVEYSFAYGAETNNNYGLTISIDSMNCYPSQRLDVNALWLDRDEYGSSRIFHGSTDEIGTGTVWKHDPDASTDGDLSSDYVGNISDVTGSVLTVDLGEEITDTINAGDICMYFPASEGDYFQFRMESVELAAGETTVYEITVEAGFDMDLFDEGGSIVLGGIPFDYGITWTDFSSPQYKHKVRQLQLDVSNFSGVLFVEHYVNLFEDQPVYVTQHNVNNGTTKIISKNQYGDCYTYGFRIYGVSVSKFEFHSFEVLFGVEQ